MSHISCQKWQAECHSSTDSFLVDVRTPMEYNSMHAVGAVNLPLGNFSPDALKQLAGDKRIGIICQSGARAKQAFDLCGALTNKIEIIEGGTMAWKQANLSLEVSERSVMSLERQSRIATGVLVLSGIVLSKVVMPGFEYLSAFVGAGLIFAGITNNCALGMMIAKMPWNQKSCCGPSSCAR